jgi:hypothetical protein
VYSKTVVLSASSAKTTTGTETNFFSLPQPAIGADFLLNVSATSSPTSLIVTVQKGWQDIAAGDTVIGGTTTGSMNWIDQWTFTTMSTTGSRQLSVGNIYATSETAWKQNAASSNTQNAGPLGDLFRIAWQISGTSFTFSVLGKFYFQYA